MLRKRIIICGLFLLLLSSVSLLSGQEEPRVVEDFYFAPLPSFNEMFSALDYLEIEDYEKALDEESFRVTEEVYPVAFALGVNTADAIMATKGRDIRKLNEIAALMNDYANFLGLSEEILRMGDDLRRLIEAGEWDELINSLEQYREEVEISLYESRQYDIFTMMQLGGWTQGLNRTTYLLTNNYREEKTGIVDQKGILNSLINNLENVRDEYLRDTPYYVMSLELYYAIKEIIYAEGETYSPEAIRELYNLTEEIKMSFR